MQQLVTRPKPKQKINNTLSTYSQRQRRAICRTLGKSTESVINHNGVGFVTILHLTTTTSISRRLCCRRLC